MTTLRIKIKIGEHEFEAEGPPDAVQAQVSAFTRLLGHEESETKLVAGVPPPPPAINKVAHVDGKVVALNVQCESLEEAVLAVLLGQQQLRGNSLVAGSEIMAGLRASGFQAERADHVLKRQAMAGNVVVTGKRRQKRYRLTTDGAEKARKIAQTLAASIPQKASTTDL